MDEKKVERALRGLKFESTRTTYNLCKLAEKGWADASVITKIV
ncbi:MAG: hypothetical protein ACETVN_01430 [Asgard group archaeon]